MLRQACASFWLARVPNGTIGKAHPGPHDMLRLAYPVKENCQTVNAFKAHKKCMKVLFEAVPGIALMPWKLNSNKPRITGIEEFPDNPNVFDNYANYAADNRPCKQIVVFQRVTSNFSIAQLKFDFPYFTKYYQREKILVNKKRLKDLFVSGIGWLSHFNTKLTWYPALTREIQGVFDIMKDEEAKSQARQLPDDSDEDEDPDEEYKEEEEKSEAK